MTMKISCLVLFGFLALPAFSEDWTLKLSPRMRAAFQEMARDDWKPQKAGELTEREKQEWSALWDTVKKAPSPQPLPSPSAPPASTQPLPSLSAPPASPKPPVEGK